MRNDKVIILGASDLQIPAIKVANEEGYHTIVLDYNPEAPGFNYADESRIISTVDMETVLEVAKESNAKFIFTSTSDAPVRTVAYVNEKLDKDLELTYKDAICATIKSDMRNRLKEFKLPIPQYYIVDNFEKFEEAIQKFETRCIVKPADSAGSRGVILYEKNSEENLEKLYEYSMSYSQKKVLLVEEYMIGNEVSVEAITVNRVTTVITITDKLITDLPYFVEIGHSEPANLSKDMWNKIVSLVEDTVAAIGIINGPSHTEIKITPDGPKIIEIAARLGGDFITSDLVPLSTGVDIVKESVKLVLKKEVELRKRCNRGSAIRFIYSNPGIITDIEYEENIEKIPGVERIVIYKKIGDKVNDLHSSNDRIGYVITSGENAEEAVRVADDVIKKIKITCR